MVSNVTTGAISATMKNQAIVDRNAMDKLLKELGKKPKLPRLQPPERIRGNVFGETGVTYMVRDKKGMANIVNHAELKVLHELLAEIEGKTAEVNTTTQAATTQSSIN
jgi:hypothetical protein